MFSGIIEKQASVLEAYRTDSTQFIKLKLLTDFTHLDLGESIAVNGVCLTVTEFLKKNDTQSTVSFFVSKESLDVTNLGLLSPEDSVNLEQSVSLQTRLSGHMVQGHVDGMAQLVDLSSHSESRLLTFKLSKSLGRYCVSKGSIALNGMSLTLQSVLDQDDSTLIQVMIIPYTWNHTNLCRLQVGGWVNIKVDMIAKYVERLCQH